MHNKDLVNLSNSVTCGGGENNLGYHFKYVFSVSKDTHYYFRFGIDFGLGGYSKLDGKIVK